eukprot:GILK01009916.1.p1 GENE.GILK01009916.1~~GILK01009916.1.p1  ORF type:complete len:371 (-),score=37.54 GILK01009916.1:111-1223(-)
MSAKIGAIILGISATIFLCLRFSSVELTTEAKAWKHEGTFFKYRGHDIFYRAQKCKQAGPCDVVVLLHGFPTSSYDWHSIWEPLTERFTLIAADFIGFGFSDKPLGYEYTIADQASLIETLVLDVQKRKGPVHLLAHDYGVTVAQELVARHREQSLLHVPTTAFVEIESVCYLNGGLFPETHQPVMIQNLLLNSLTAPIVKLFTFKTLFASSFAAVFGPNSKPSREDMDTWWSIINHNGGISITNKLLHYIEERKKFRSRWVYAVTDSPVPLRILNGPADPVSGAHMVKRYMELTRGGHTQDVIILRSDIGHYPQIEAPQSVITHYVDFFNQLHTMQDTVAPAAQAKASASSSTAHVKHHAPEKTVHTGL